MNQQIREAQLDAKPITLSALVREALDKHNGIIDPAVDDLVDRLRRDKPLLRLILDSVVRDAVETRAQGAIRSERQAIIQQATYSRPASLPPREPAAVAPTSRRENVIRLAQGIAASMLDMPLAGGIRLRDCGKEFLEQEATRFGALSRETGRKSRFLSSIALIVPKNKIVGDVVTDARALELWQAA